VALPSLLCAGCLVLTPLDDAAPDGVAGAGGSDATGANGELTTVGGSGGTVDGAGGGGQTSEPELPPANGAGGTDGGEAQDQVVGRDQVAGGDQNAGGSGGEAGAPSMEVPAYVCDDPLATWTASGPYLVRFERVSGDCPRLPNSEWPIDPDPDCSDSGEVGQGCSYSETSFCIGYQTVTRLEQAAPGANVTGTLEYSGAAASSAGAFECTSTYALELSELPAEHTCDPAVDFAGVFRVSVSQPEIDECGLITPGITDAQYVDPMSVLDGCEVVDEEQGSCSYAAAFECPTGSGAIAMGQALPGGRIDVIFDGIEDGCSLAYSVSYFPADLP
jgi:hypothetical protein